MKKPLKFKDIVDDDVEFVQIIFYGEHIVNIDLRCKSASLMKNIFRNLEITHFIWYAGPKLLKLFIEEVK